MDSYDDNDIFPFKKMFRERDWKKLSDYIEQDKYAVKMFAKKEKLTLTHVCCFDNSTPLEIIQLLTEQYPMQVRMLSHYAPSTPLHKAICCRLDLDKLQYLLETDFKLKDKTKMPSSVVTKDYNGRTPLHLFVKRFGWYMRDKDAFDFITKLIDAYPEAINCVDIGHGYTPLHYAITNDQKESLIRLLLEKSPSSALILNNYMETPLHVAIRMKAGIGEIELLLKYSKVAATVQDIEGRTPLCWAWIRHVFECNESVQLGDYTRFDYQRRNLPKNFSTLQDNCVKTIFQDMELKKSSNFAFQKFWNLIKILLSSPSLIIHALCSRPCPNAIIQIAIKGRPKQLSTQDEDGNFPLHLIMSSLKDERVVDKILGSPVMTVEMILQSYPQAAKRSNFNLSLPLHIFLCHRSEKHVYDDILKLLIESYPNALRIRDGVYKLYPFMLPAMNSNLTLCYQILKEAPEMVLTRPLKSED